MTILRHDANGQYRHAAGVEVRELGEELFLVAPGPGSTHHLDKMASAVWRFLAEPHSAPELIDLFQTAFPGVPKRKIARDIGVLLVFLEERGLIVRIRLKPSAPM